ncbi:TPA: nucleoid-associated protein, YbaB/EbfC family, partial [bacterium]|nr:nucleoid-associated protein, YbaB/EbfC family [bacterium]
MNLNKLMKEMQKVQVETEKAQNELNDMTFEGVSGGGAVTIKLTGKYKVIGIEISDDALKDSDKEMLQDMIKVALDDVLKKI